MWIDFKLYFYVRIHKILILSEFLFTVVNWFQIVFLRENSQGAIVKWLIVYSCELISNCIFTWEFTSIKNFIVPNIGLWIDFKLYFYVRIHKPDYKLLEFGGVVNWFQIVFLRENSQVLLKTILLILCCELISNCIFTWEFTSSYQGECSPLKLWIDFKLYFYVRIHKFIAINHVRQFVVNWFQIVFLRENSQAKGLCIRT